MTRIAWSKAARLEDVELENPDSDVDGDAGASTFAVVAKGTATDGARSSEDNNCYLVWEGMLKDRAFNDFKAKSCPMDRGIGIWLTTRRLKKKRSCFDWRQPLSRRLLTLL